MRRFCLLTSANSNPKLAKGMGRGYLSYVLHLAPHTLSGYQVCPAADGCEIPCLNTAGHGGIAAGGVITYAALAAGARNAVQAARIRKTRGFFEARSAFMADLVWDIEGALEEARRLGMRACFRLNGTSDIRWERVACARAGKAYANIMAAFPRVQFYDYTKLSNRRDLPANYHLTFSLGVKNDLAAWAALGAGLNVAVVFDRYRERPAEFMGRAVIDGDESDLRFADPLGVIVGLKSKGHARHDRSGFVR